jgi:hypothetical protein
VREFKARWVKYAAGLLFALIGLNAGLMMRARPVVYVEGTKNNAARRQYEIEIPPLLRTLTAARPGGVVLMNTSVYPELVSLTGIPLRQTINESDLEIWKRRQLMRPWCWLSTATRSTRPSRRIPPG